jgi:formate dehydrogenase subunit delta
MHVERLVAMANDIANFFAAESGDAAPDDIARHIKRFWEPRMRAQIAEYAQAGGHGLSAPALAAAKLLASSPTPAPVPSAAKAGER